MIHPYISGSFLPHIVVVDVGSEFTRVGYAGESDPIILKPSLPFHDVVDEYVSLLGNTSDLHMIISESDKKQSPILMEYLFENKVAKSILFMDSTILDLFSYGKSTGTIISYGGYTSISLIVDGSIEKKSLSHGHIHFDQYIAKRHEITIEAAQKYKESNINIISIEERKKEKSTVRKKEKSGLEEESIYATEVFNRGEAVKDMIEGSRNKGSLSSNVFMSGSGAQINGLEVRMKEELRGYRNKVVYEKKEHTFLGGSILGSIIPSRQLFIGSKDYEEHGMNAISRKSIY